MAIPGIPQQFNVTTANQQVLAQWALSAGATSYDLQRSTDNVTFTNLATVTATSYVDTSAALSTKYYYKIAATNSDGSSPYTTAQSAICTPTGEMSLAAIRLAAQQRADRVNSNFVTLQEWNFFINQAMFELYDLLVTVFEDYYVASPAVFITSNAQNRYALPNGSNQFLDEAGATVTPRPFYKLLGMDLSANGYNNANGWVTMRKFNFIDRNKYTYPNGNANIYGVYNLQYRVIGNQVEFIPNPSANQTVRIWYIPRLIELLQDTDTTDIGISGWLQYVIIRAAKYALDKEESDTQKLDSELLFLKARIEETAANRDAGQPDRVSNTRQSSGFGWDNNDGGWSGGWGGW